jgi:WhiB family redox-sensing transcriptional regulator
LFFPLSASGPALEQIDEALRICASCLVKRQCLEYAMETGEATGIWGGTTPDERIRVRRQQAARRRQEAKRDVG